MNDGCAPLRGQSMMMRDFIEDENEGGNKADKDYGNDDGDGDNDGND